MKIALFEPYSPKFIRGNSIAAERLARNVQKQSIRVRTFSLRDTKGKNEIIAEIKRFKPDILHGFHACKTGPLVRDLSRKLHLPYIISLRGTDAYEDAFKKSACKTMSDVLRDAWAVVVFHSFMKQTLLKNFPFVRDKIKIIPQGVSTNTSSMKSSLKKPSPSGIVFGYAGGLRKLKSVHEIIKNLKPVQQKYPSLHLYIAGPVIEKSYARKVLREIKKHSWITYPGEIPHDRMTSFYALLDVYINASTSEGTSNAVLEAMAHGKSVLASNIEGNRAVVKNRKTGLLYTTGEDFIKKAIFLINSRSKRMAKGAHAKQFVKRHHSSSQEAARYRELYTQCPLTFSRRP